MRFTLTVSAFLNRAPWRCPGARWQCDRSQGRG
jgi:hypothetical protein